MYQIPKEYLQSNNDFGFIAVDEDQVVDPIITDVKTATQEQIETHVQQVVSEHKDKLIQLERLIIPLLVNLLKDADTKEYIKWPNRKPVIEQQIEKILKITRS